MTARRVPAAYLRRMRASRPHLYDHNVNGCLAGEDRSVIWRQEKAVCHGR